MSIGLIGWIRSVLGLLKNNSRIHWKKCGNTRCIRHLGYSSAVSSRLRIFHVGTCSRSGQYWITSGNSLSWATDELLCENTPSVFHQDAGLLILAEKFNSTCRFLHLPAAGLNQTSTKAHTGYAGIRLLMSPGFQFKNQRHQSQSIPKRFMRKYDEIWRGIFGSQTTSDSLNQAMNSKQALLAHFCLRMATASRIMSWARNRTSLCCVYLWVRSSRLQTKQCTLEIWGPNVLFIAGRRVMLGFRGGRNLSAWRLTFSSSISPVLHGTWHVSSTFQGFLIELKNGKAISPIEMQAAVDCGRLVGCVLILLPSKAIWLRIGPPWTHRV